MLKEVEKLKRAVDVFVRAVRSRETPLLAKVLLMSGLAYLIVPSDLVPDIVPILGFIDDVAALILAGSAFLRMIEKKPSAASAGEKKD